MLLYVFLITAVTASFAVADVCFDPALYIQKLQPVHATCKAEMKSRSDDKSSNSETCYIKYRACHLREIGVLNEAKNGVDHAKMLDLMIKFSKDKDGLATKLSGCKQSAFIGSDKKISDYYDCIQEKCPEMAIVRKETKDSATTVC